MSKQNRPWLALLAFCTTAALVIALGLAILIASATVAFAVAQSLGSSATRKAVASSQEFAGMITDSKCGARHAKDSGQSPADCVRACVRNGSQYVLVNGDARYALEGNLAAVGKWAGQRVKISGALQGEIIRVSSVAPI